MHKWSQCDMVRYHHPLQYTYRQPQVFFMVRVYKQPEPCKLIKTNTNNNEYRLETEIINTCLAKR